MPNYEEPFIQKMLNYYNQGGLIIFAKSNNYFGTNTVSEEDINIFYELVIDVNGKFKNNPFQITLLSKWNEQCVNVQCGIESAKREVRNQQYEMSNRRYADNISVSNEQ